MRRERLTVAELIVPHIVLLVDVTTGFRHALERAESQEGQLCNERAVPVACCDTVHRGVNYVEGKIILPTLDGQVTALDANTGKELWKAKNADPSKGETITAAGLVIRDKYIASVSGGEFGVRCHVTAYNINTGQQVWRAYSMGPDEDVRLAPDFNAANPY